MQILAAPMAVSLPARGPATQTRELMEQALRRGHSFTTAAAHDAAWTDLPGIPNLEVPSPRLLGWIPDLVVRKLVKPILIDGKKGARRTRMVSFEHVQSALGLASRRYFMRDYTVMADHLARVRPDVVVAGRYSALLAAKHAGIPVAIIVDKPQTAEFASSPELTRHLRKHLSDRGWGDFASILDIAWQADLVLVPNLRVFSDLGQHEAVYVGSLKSKRPDKRPEHAGDLPRPRRNLILAYPGVSGIDVDYLADRLAKYLCSRNEQAVQHANPPLEAIIVHPGRSGRIGPVAFTPRFEKDETLERALVMIHHGGQNSCQDCLREGIPQLIIHGGHFERAANAALVAQAGAGLVWSKDDSAVALTEQLDALLDDPRFGAKATKLGLELNAGGGWDQVLEQLECLVRKEHTHET